MEKQTDGVLLVELFDSSGKSFNVQVIESGYGELDERQCHVLPASVTTPLTSVGAHSSQSQSVEIPNHVPASESSTSFLVILIRCEIKLRKFCHPNASQPKRSTVIMVSSRHFREF